MEKQAKTKYEIDSLLSKRWSPRSFANKQVEQEKLQRLFEAARWSASAYNEQPWRFILGIKGKDETYSMIYDSMVQFNKDWAKLAPVLMVVVSKNNFTHNNKPNETAVYDTGQAIANLSVQATKEGLHLHQMGGFDKEKIIKDFELPEGYTPQALVALGYIGKPDMLPEDLAKGEYSERLRKDFDEFVFSGKFTKKTAIFRDFET